MCEVNVVKIGNKRGKKYLSSKYDISYNLLKMAQNNTFGIIDP